MKALRYYFIDNEKFFNGFKPYGDNIVEEISTNLSFFSKAALSILPVIDFRPDVIHCHDWQTGTSAGVLKRAFCRRRVLPWNQVCYDDS